jgi:DNA polymerase-1
METARLSSRAPNVQNLPKRSEGDIERIFGKDKKPPDLRTIFVPRPDWYIIEADWTQAELFALAALSGDVNMWAALNTPGKDLHDLTAIQSFSLRLVGPDGNEIGDNYLVRLARDEGVKAYESYVKKVTYVDQRGKRMTRAEFKNTIRVSAKNVNFGIPYGRGAAAIAVQVKGETGTDRTIRELTQELELVVNTWKKVTYPGAWNFLEKAADSAEHMGYVENAWGRRRLFPRTKDTNVNAIRREAQNYPIQSTVADTCLIAMAQLRAFRDQNNLRFRLINQVHDAILFEVPGNELEIVSHAAKAIMGGIRIPIPGRPALQIGVDVEIMTRWGEKLKAA